MYIVRKYICKCYIQISFNIVERPQIQPEPSGKTIVIYRDDISLIEYFIEFTAYKGQNVPQ